jgi:hypothetical protein
MKEQNVEISIAVAFNWKLIMELNDIHNNWCIERYTNFIYRLTS